MTGPRRRLRLVVIAAALIALLDGAFLPIVAQAAPAPQPLLDVSVIYDDFESSFPGTTWTVTDSDPTNATDYWGSSSYRSAAGNGSVWSAQLGNRSQLQTVFSDDFEGAWPGNWTATDRLAADGDDYWGQSGTDFHSGNRSLWSAQVGLNAANSSNTKNNTELLKYDDRMNATVTRPVNLTNMIDVTLTYWYRVDAEACSPPCDGLMVMYFSGNWHYIDDHTGRYGPWSTSTVAIPSTTTSVGFLFYSDVGNQFVGAYVDDVVVTGTRVDLNTALRQYDDGVNATMSRLIDVSAYPTARMNFSYWLQTDSSADYLLAMYYTDDWHPVLNVTGSSGAWTATSAAIPNTSTKIGFRFIADASGHAEGAYLDELRIWGYIPPPSCVANVTQTTGLEGSTAFAYQGSAGLGQPPYQWLWTFGDGTNSTQNTPYHSYTDVGVYTASLRVTDAFAQVCNATAPSVTVNHDFTTVSVLPGAATVVEGESFTFSAADARGHLMPANWSAAPAGCGDVAPLSGSSTVLRVSPDAGGLACTVAATIAGVSGTSSVSVAHNVSAIVITPTPATAVEGGTLGLSAVDANGHALAFSWSPSCGRVAPDTGPSTVFSAIVTGGVTCTVTATFGGASASTVVTVVHDTGVITLAPSTVTLREGRSQSITAVDVYGHAFNAAWTLDPPSCGALNSSSGPAVTFSISAEAGGTTCTVTASYAGNTRAATFTIVHDTSTLSIEPPTATVVEGTTQGFGARDAYGHAFAAEWSMAPSACGSLSATSGPTTMLSVSPEAGGSSCTVTARAGNLSKIASLSIIHSAPASITITPSTLMVAEGGAQPVTATVVDGSGHALASLLITWSTTCGALSNTTGASVAVQATTAVAGATCTVTATHDTISSNASVAVTHATPFTVKITRTPTAGGAEALSATVVDANGREVPGMEIQWSASCGSLSSATGPTTTFTPSSDAACTVTAQAAGGSETASGAVTAPATGSIVLPLVGAIAAAGVAAAVLFLWKRKKQPADAATSPPEQLPPTV